MKVLHDSDPMPYGVHKGKDMEDVPAGYLLWLLDNQRATPPVESYIYRNMDVLLKQQKEESRTYER